MAKGTRQALVSVATAVPEPTYCKQTNGLVRISLEGESLNLQGFGYPTTGFAVHYAAQPSPIPFYPDDSGGLSTTEEIDVDPGTGEWECRLLDSCDTTPTPRTVIVWYKYETEFDVHWLVEVFPITIPACTDTTHLPPCA